MDIQGESALQSALDNQVVTVAVEAANSIWKNYKTGVIQQCPGDRSNHAVIAVGYGTKDGVDYFKIKNTWGTTWGERGYMYLQRGVGGKGMCNVAERASYPQLSGAQNTTTLSPAPTSTPTADPTPTAHPTLDPTGAPTHAPTTPAPSKKPVTKRPTPKTPTPPAFDETSVTRADHGAIIHKAQVWQVQGLHGVPGPQRWLHGGQRRQEILRLFEEFLWEHLVRGSLKCNIFALSINFRLNIFV